MSVAYNQIAHREKRDVVNRRSEKPTAVQMIQDSVVRSNNMAEKKTPLLPPYPTAISVKADMTLDLPTNLTEYTKPESVIQLRKLRRRTLKGN